jgi:hypothetical protein
LQTRWTPGKSQAAARASFGFAVALGEQEMLPSGGELVVDVAGQLDPQEAVWPRALG